MRTYDLGNIHDDTLRSRAEKLRRELEVIEGELKARGLAPRTQEDEEYAHYLHMGGMMARGKWEHVRKLHMQHIESDRLSPYEAELML
jgi:hypothetical protein